jgi:hypothetical protein
MGNEKYQNLFLIKINENNSNPFSGHFNSRFFEGTGTTGN